MPYGVLLKATSLSEMSRLRYRSYGSGPALILLHGFCEGGYIWDQMVPLLSNEFTVYCPDLPGHGESPLSEEINSISDIGAIINEWVLEENLYKPAIIGHSMGGYVLLAAIDQQPALYSKAGLFHSTPLADSTEKQKNRNKSIEFILEHGTAPFFDIFIPSLYFREGPWHESLAGRIRKTKKETLLRYTAWMRDRADLQNVLGKLDDEFLILAGQKDEFIPVGSLKELQNHHEFKFQVLNDVGHLGMMEDPKACAAIIRDYLNYGD